MLKKTKEQEIVLLARKRVTYEIEHQGQPTPSKQSLTEQISKEQKVEPNLVSIRHIFSKFGINKSKIIAHIYKDEKMLKYLETAKGKKAKIEQKAAA